MELSRTFKLEYLDPEIALDQLQYILMTHDNGKYIVDVSPATHAVTSGVAYVQYLAPHRDIILSTIQEVLQSPVHKCGLTTSRFPEGPSLYANGASQAPTAQSNSHSLGNQDSAPLNRFMRSFKPLPPAPQPLPHLGDPFPNPLIFHPSPTVQP